MDDNLKSIDAAFNIMTNTTNLIQFSYDYLFNSEFSDTDSNNNSFAEISLMENDSEFYNVFNNNKFESKGFLDIANVIYLGTISLLDNLYLNNNNSQPYHIKSI